jgi:cytochrome c-type biogenesis protein CcmH/NrfG
VAPVCLAVAVLTFLPPWYAQRLTDRALEGGSRDVAASLRLAHRLDPVSTAPLIAQAALASSSSDQLRYLREAARREPRVLQTQYFLGSVLLNTGHKAEARRVFEHAAELDPGNQAVARALRLAR